MGLSEGRKVGPGEGAQVKHKLHCINSHLFKAVEVKHHSGHKSVGSIVGFKEGDEDGFNVGSVDGCKVGSKVGVKLGIGTVGSSVGSSVGLSVGHMYAYSDHSNVVS